MVKRILKERLCKKELVQRPRAFDVIGDIAIISLPEELKKKKKLVAENLLKTQKNIKTVLLKESKVKGRLRKRKLSFVSGIKKKETTHKENNCIFKLDVEECYFSPRLANERAELAKKCLSNEKILVMFAGVGPYAIVVAKKSKAKIIYAIELNRKAVAYMKENIKLNRLSNIIALQGDVKKVLPKLKKMKKKFDRIMMPRPKLKENFLREAFLCSKKGTTIHFYDFLKENELKEAIGRIEKEAKKSRKKIKILSCKKAGEIAPYQYRYRIDFKVL